MTGPSFAEEFDPNTVTPGVIGFVITFLIAAAVVFLVLDMNRRVRRVRYRGEITERLDAEEAAASATGGASGAAAGATSAAPGAAAAERPDDVLPPRAADDPPAPSER